MDHRGKTKVLRASREKENCHLKWLLDHRANAFEILNDIQLHAVKLSMMGEENKGIFRHLRSEYFYLSHL